eukprot:g81882.t1
MGFQQSVVDPERLNDKRWVKAGYTEGHMKLHPPERFDLDGKVYPIIQCSNTDEKRVKNVHSPGYMGDIVQFEGRTYRDPQPLFWYVPVRQLQAVLIEQGNHFDGNPPSSKTDTRHRTNSLFVSKTIHDFKYYVLYYVVLNSGRQSSWQRPG